MKKVLTIAGSDCSGGAGIQAVYQNNNCSQNVCNECDHSADGAEYNRCIWNQGSGCRIVGDQMDCIFTDIRPDAVKIGMVPMKKSFG